MSSKPRIIICEDNVVTALSIKQMLEYNGYSNSEIVSSGENLIAAAAKKFPSLIILDLTLSGDLDGFEAIERITQQKNIPFIIVSGHSEYFHLIDSYQLEPFATLQKPIDYSELLFNIQEATEAESFNR